MTLSADGRLSPSIGTPFTHILKPAGTSGFEALPLVEWAGLALARSAGFTVPASALIAMPDGMPPALLAERFDSRAGADDDRLLAMQDLGSVLGLSPQAKYDGTIDDLLDRMRAAAAAITLPTLPGYGPSGEAAVNRTLEICQERISAFA